jgi:Eukaryotic translation initiation factor eIF2A
VYLFICRYFMTATLAPRMNVDNGFKIFKYNGIGPVVHVRFEQVFQLLYELTAHYHDNLVLLNEWSIRSNKLISMCLF